MILDSFILILSRGLGIVSFPSFADTMIKIESHKVTSASTPIRLLDFCMLKFEFINTRAGIKKLIKKGFVKIDGMPTSGGQWLVADQKVELYSGYPAQHKVFEMKLDIVYEDDEIAVIYKPAGIEVSGNKFKTIQNALVFNLKPSHQKDLLSRPVPVHRLDYPTSGLLICAKTHQAAVNLGRQFEEKTIEKTYVAIVNGKIENEGRIDLDIDGKHAETLFEKVKTISSIKVGHISLLKLNPLTGRTHQLRKHLASIGHPIVGDGLYNTDFPLLKGKGLFLSATEIYFYHPISKSKIELKTNIPHKFISLLAREEERFLKFDSL